MSHPTELPPQDAAVSPAVRFWGEHLRRQEVMCEPDPVVRCSHCDWVGRAAETIRPIQKALQALRPGAEVPAGECPECSAFCYLFVGEFSALPTPPDCRYLVAEAWTHLDNQNREYFLRWVYDRWRRQLIRAEFRSCQTAAWQEIPHGSAHWADVVEHLTVANAEALEKPQDWELQEIGGLPGWAAGTPGV